MSIQKFLENGCYIGVCAVVFPVAFYQFLRPLFTLSTYKLVCCSHKHVTDFTLYNFGSTSRHWSQTTTIRSSASSTSLDVWRTRLSTVGDRAFPVAAARLWSSLPSHVTAAPSLSIFCCRLKSHLFSLSYPSYWLLSFVQCPRSDLIVILDTIIVISFRSCVMEFLH